jgi:hypothetical protein
MSDTPHEPGREPQAPDALYRLQYPGGNPFYPTRDEYNDGLFQWVNGEWVDIRIVPVEIDATQWLCREPKRTVVYGSGSKEWCWINGETHTPLCGMYQLIKIGGDDERHHAVPDRPRDG